jgi:hypothetical protein
MALPATRVLRLRAAAATPSGAPPLVVWDLPTGVLLEDGTTATLAMADGLDGQRLDVLFRQAAEVLFPTWQVTGLEVRLRAACVGNTNPALSMPELGISILPGSGDLYQSEQRVTPLPYAVAATGWIILGGPDDLWSIPDVYAVAQDAATIGLQVRIDPQPWVMRAASIEVDAVELVLYLAQTSFPPDPGVETANTGLSRTRVVRFAEYGEAPAVLAYGELAANVVEQQLWVGNQFDAPVPLITFRGEFQAARSYKTGEVMCIGSILYLAEIDKPAGVPFQASEWRAVS